MANSVSIEPILENATAILRSEHETILRVLDRTDAIARSLRQGQQVAPEILLELVEFYREFVDRQHRPKEEDLLFPTLQQKGVCASALQEITMNLLDHEEGQFWIASMHQLARAYRQGCSMAGCRWGQTAGSYAQMLRGHIEAENQVLFPIAERILTPDEQRDLAGALEVLGGEKPSQHEARTGTSEVGAPAQSLRREATGSCPEATTWVKLRTCDTKLLHS